MKLSRRRIFDLAAAVVASGLVLLVFGLPFLRRLACEPLLRTSFWGVAVLASFGGWGTLIARACWPKATVSLALRAVWGASLIAAVGGLLGAVSALSAGVFYGLVVVGDGLLIAHWVRERSALGRSLRVGLKATLSSPALACALLFVVVGLALHYFGGAADASSNPYDDDVSYYPSAKQLLEHGTLIEPFSFRRMSTLGGQHLFHAMLLLRVPVLHLNLFDRAMCFVLAAFLLLSHRVDRARVPMLARLVSLAVLIALPNTSINSASYYSGLAFFIGLFQTLESMPQDLATDARVAVRRVVPLALTAAATCTLRQNYQAAVAGFVVLAYVFALLRNRRQRPFARLLVEPAAALLLTAVFVLPWLVLLYRSSGTFLFPLMKGTFRAGVDVRSQDTSLGTHLKFFVDVWLQPEPIKALPFFFLVGLSVREANIRKPLASFWLASFAAVALLAWSFTLSDSGNLARYTYGFVAAGAFVTWQTVAAKLTMARVDLRARGAGMVQAAIVLFGFFFSLQSSADPSPTRKMLETRIDDVAELLRRSAPMQTEHPLALEYQRLQNAAPAGARILVMVDRPYYLDFRRNEIWNLDMPGLASLAPDMPCFRGSAPLADYFRAKGIRYVAFVQSSRSTFLYRREIWLDHIWDREEIWRIYAPYMVDVMDNLADLARTHRHLQDEDGMVMLDLEAGH